AFLFCTDALKPFGTLALFCGEQSTFMRFAARVAAVVLATSSLFAQSSGTIGPRMYSGLNWRLLGPFRAGRITSVSGVPSDPAVYYVGTPDGGVWKTNDGGRVWKPTMDTLPVSSIGAVAVAPSNPNVVYAGTGEESAGEGMFKSTDAGATWTNAGLKETKYIDAIIVDPRNADVVTVAVSGAPDPNENRGVFRTTDGGRSWKRVLFLDNETGAVDMNGSPDARVLLVSLMHRPSPGAQHSPMPVAAPKAPGPVPSKPDTGPDS